VTNSKVKFTGEASSSQKSGEV